MNLSYPKHPIVEMDKQDQVSVLHLVIIIVLLVGMVLEVKDRFLILIMDLVLHILQEIFMHPILWIM